MIKILYLVLISFLSFTALAEVSVVVVTSTKSKIETLSSSQLKFLYYKKIKTIGHGLVVEPRDQIDGPVKEAFYEHYFGRTQEDVKNYWAIQVFRGREAPPSFVGTENNEAMINWLSRNLNSIGYIEGNQINSLVKIVPITE